jgi:hypothetical protein
VAVYGAGQLPCFEIKRSSLNLKTRHKQLLGSLPLAIVFPNNGIIITLKVFWYIPFYILLHNYVFECLFQILQQRELILTALNKLIMRLIKYFINERYIIIYSLDGQPLFPKD